jgi:hypothetical protein
MNQKMDKTTLTAMLEPVSAALAADGYELSAAVDSGALMVRIAAGPDACEDCLVPKDMMVEMIRNVLHGSGLEPTRLEVTYPNDH